MTNLFYSLPFDIQNHILCILTRSEYDKVIRSIPEEVRRIKADWRAKQLKLILVNELQSFSHAIRMYYVIGYVKSEYLAHLILNMSDLDRVFKYEHYLAFVEAKLREQYEMNSIEMEEFPFHDVYLETVEQFYLLQEIAFVASY